MEMNEIFEEYYDKTYEETLPEELIDKYDIVECLSCVEECDTLLVRQKQTGKKMVAKCYATDSILFEQMEKGTIPGFLGKFRNEKYYCVLREYVEGVSLEEFVITNYMTEDIILEIAIKLVNAMRELHNSEPIIIHRDIKPQNIIVKEDGSIALIDFGISRVYKKDEKMDTVFCGTVGFAPPEQYGFMQTDIRSDIYAFGVVLSWMLTGKTNPLKEPMTGLERVAAKCFEFSPNKRYQNDEAVLKALHKVTRTHITHVRKRIKWTCVSALLIIAAVLAGGAAYHFFMPNRAVTFKEPLIEEAVRAELKRPSGAITKEDLLEVRKLYIHGNTVSTSEDMYYDSLDEWVSTGMMRGTLKSIEDLLNMTNLQIVYIGGEHITDISPLKELEQLEKVEFGFNDISDISALEGKKYLT